MQYNFVNKNRVPHLDCCVGKKLKKLCNFKKVINTWYEISAFTASYVMSCVNCGKVLEKDVQSISMSELLNIFHV